MKDEYKKIHAEIFYLLRPVYDKFSERYGEDIAAVKLLYCVFVALADFLKYIEDNSK